MIDWVDITTASWEGILRPEELAQIEETTLEQELVKMAAEIRDMIGSHSPNTLSADPLKIPPGFVGRAMIIVRNRVLTGIPDYAIDEDRRKQAEMAEKWLLGVARGNIRPQQATDAVPTAAANKTPAPGPRINARDRRFGRDMQDGI
ncbi:MAG: hypothetical protein Q8Q59_06355 [Luteolibacter sp.]|jgi:hypothetical protein|nr:hypothetical protein [Luteolibacter sp.]